MSISRRKSKNPQKCAWENDNSYQETETNLVTNDRSNSLPVGRAAAYKTVPIQHTQLDVSFTGIKTEKKPKSYTHNEMTVEEVMQSTRQTTLGECNLCKISFKDWISSVEHVQLHRSTFIPSCIGENSNLQPCCIICDKPYHNKLDLVLHARTEHDLMKAPYGCVLCGKVFPTLKMLQDHIDLKDITLHCPVCSSVHGHEYELYSHLSQCLQTFHPHLKYLRCHICDHRIVIDDAANHLIQHSFHNHKFRPKIERPQLLQQTEQLPVKPQNSNIFLCEVCNGRFASFEEFKDHLYKHLESKKFCPLCLLKGFVRADFIVRHLLIRCPRRSREQVEFGDMIINLGKFYSRNFLEVLKDMQLSPPVQEGIQTWMSVPVVNEFLKSFESFTKEELRRIPELSDSFQTESGTATDIDLLSWLTDFESNLYNEKRVEAKRLDANEVLAIDSNFRNGIQQNRNTGRPIEIDLDSGEGQVILSSKTTSVDSLKKPKMDHRPNLDFYKGKLPGADLRLLPPFDLQRLKRLNDQATKMMEFNPVEDHIKRGEFTEEHFLRLELESQFLRKSNPFFVRQNLDSKHHSPLYRDERHKPPRCVAVDSADTLRLMEEAKALEATTRGSFVEERDLMRLLTEAKELARPEEGFCIS